MRTQGEKAECAVDSLNQVAFAAALTAMLSAFDEELKSLWLALFADIVWRPTDKDPAYIILPSQFPFIITHLTFCVYKFFSMFRRRLLIQDP